MVSSKAFCQVISHVNNAAVLNKTGESKLASRALRVAAASGRETTVSVLVEVVEDGGARASALRLAAKKRAHRRREVSAQGSERTWAAKRCALHEIMSTQRLLRCSWQWWPFENSATVTTMRHQNGTCLDAKYNSECNALYAVLKLAG